MLTWLAAEVTPSPPTMWWDDPLQFPNQQNRGWVALLVIGVAVAILVWNGARRRD